MEPSAFVINPPEFTDFVWELRKQVLDDSVLTSDGKLNKNQVLEKLNNLLKIAKEHPDNYYDEASALLGECYGHVSQPLYHNLCHLLDYEHIQEPIRSWSDILQPFYVGGAVAVTACIINFMSMALQDNTERKLPPQAPPAPAVSEPNMQLALAPDLTRLKA